MVIAARGRRRVDDGLRHDAAAGIFDSLRICQAPGDVGRTIRILSFCWGLRFLLGFHGSHTISRTEKRLLCSWGSNLVV